MKQPYVSTLIEQDFSDEEKALARDNIAALSSADLGPYATREWVSDNFLSDGDFREFATHEEVYSATSGKMDATEASAFYPRYSNPEGYLTSIPSEYVTDTEMSSYVAQETSAFLTSGDLDGYATETWVSGQGYLKNLFLAEYGVTTFGEIRDAYSKGKIVYCRLTSNQYGSGRMAFLAYVNLASNPTSSNNFFEFQYYRSNSSLLSNDSIFVYQIKPDNVWTTTERIAGNISDWTATSGRTQILNKPDLSVYATEQWVLNKNYITSADVPPQIEYSAGQNVNINNHIISATDTTYSAGSGLALNGTTFSNTAPNVKSDWNAAAGSAGEILNKPTIPTKTSELNNDSGFITSASIPTVNNGTLTIQRNGTQVATFSANQSGNATANISVPTDTNDLTNGAGFITSADIPSTDDIVLISVNASTPYDDVAAAFLAGKTPVLYYAYQNSLQYYWFISKTASSYTFAAVSKGNFGNVVTEYSVNSDNTVSSSSQTSAKRFSVNDETLTIDNSELKWRYPAATYFGSATSNGGSTSWISGMTSSQFNRKLVNMPLPSAGIYLVQYTGTGRFVDSLTDTGSPGMLFRVCIGDQTQSFSMFAGNWQFADSSSNSQYTGFSGFTIANIPSNYITDVSLNISNNDYAPLSGQTQTFSWTSLRAAWFKLPQ